MPDRLLTKCLACFPALSEWCKLEFTIALVSQGHHPHPHCPVWHTAVDLGSASVACLSPHWPSPAQPFLRVGPPLLYQTRGVYTRGELQVTGGETARPSLQLFYCLTCASAVACVSSGVMCMGLFFNQTQFCFLIMIFSHLLLKYTRMLFFVLEDVVVQKSDCFLRGISYWWHYWLGGMASVQALVSPFWVPSWKASTLQPGPALGSLSQTDRQFKQCFGVLICTFWLSGWIYTIRGCELISAAALCFTFIFIASWESSFTLRTHTVDNYKMFFKFVICFLSLHLGSCCWF